MGALAGDRERLLFLRAAAHARLHQDAEARWMRGLTVRLDFRVST